jgi:DNA damage-binding protein 1
MQSADDRLCAIPGEVSAVSIISSTDLPSPVLAISTWSNEILLYSLEHLKTNQPVITTINEQFFTTSLLLKPSVSSSGSTSGMQLLAGLSDGSMIVYDLALSDQGGGLEVKGRKPSSLGTRPLAISAISSQDGDEKIVAVGLSERMSIIFESRDRVDFSSVSTKVRFHHDDTDW